MNKKLPLKDFTRIIFRFSLVLLAGIFVTNVTHAQCGGLSLTNSAGSSVPGTLTVSSANGTLQRIRWYKDGVLVATQEAAWSANATTIASGTNGGSNKTQLYIPQLHGFKDTVYFSEYNHRIWKWWPGLATPIMLIGNTSGTAGAPPTGINEGSCVFVDATNNLFVGEFSGKHTNVLDKTTGQLAIRSNGFFVTSVNVFRDSLYITDWGNNRITMYAPGANPSSGGINVLTGLTQPRFVFWYRDSLYVLYLNGSILKKYPRGSTPGTISSTGITVAGTGTAGSALNQLNVCLGVYADRLGNFYMAEQANARITKWVPGATAGIVVAGTGTAGLTANQLNLPAKVWISDYGYMYVSDDSRIQQFAPTIDNTLPATTAGVYKAVTENFDGCLDSISFAIGVPGQPGLFTAGKPTVCNGETNVTYSINAVANATSYQWSYAPATGVTITGSGTSVTVTFGATATSGVLSVKGVNAQSMAGMSRDSAITVNPLPNLSVTPTTSVAICTGGNTNLTASGANTYTWTPNNGLSTTTGASITATPGSTVTYTITGTGANNCVNTITKTVTVNTLPPVSVTPTTAITLCASGSTTLTASGANTYAWAPNTGLSATTGTSVTATPTSTITYTITGTDANNCTNTVTKTVTINPLPVATATPSGATSFCAGNNVVLTANSGTNYGYTWKNGTATVGSNNAYTVTTSGSYKVVVTNTATNCKDSSTAVNVTVHNIPSVTLTPADTGICAGSTAMLNVITQDTGLTYTWIGNLAGVIPSASANFLQVNTTDTYFAIATLSVSPHCFDTTNVASVTIHPLPSPVVSWDNKLLHAGNGYVNYQWNMGNNPITGATDSTFKPKTNGGYSVTVTDSNGCTNISAVKNINNVGVSINDVTALGDQIKIYPNPAATTVNIQSPIPVNAMLISIDGRKVLAVDNASTIDINSVADGMYILIITDKNGIPVKREQLVKKN